MTHSSEETTNNMNYDVINPIHSMPADSSAASYERAWTILVVDDFADNRELLRRRLCRGGYDVIEACDGYEALRVVEQRHIDLLLLDIMMPGMEGTEVVKVLRQKHSALQLPIIMVSAKDQSDDIANCLKLGANDYITKPVDFTVALARVEAQLERKRDVERSSRRDHSLQPRPVDQPLADRHKVEGHANAWAERQSDGEPHFVDPHQSSVDHDSLTGLQNRTLFRRRLDEHFGDCTKPGLEAALLLVDLERFKTINDVHGHLVGDELLKAVAWRICEAVGERDLIARLGSDEFAVLVPNDDPPGLVYEIGERVRRALSTPFKVQAKELWLRASCGIAWASSSGRRPDDLLKAADLAMRRAKAEGHGRLVTYKPDLLEAQRERSVIEVGLRRALHQGELEIYYQPIIRTCDHRLACFEALVRWNHPEKGVLQPESFLPIAEEVGLASEIGSWILLNACGEAVAWPAHFHVAVNVSGAQFASDELIGNVRKALTATRLQPNRLELEIPELSLLDAGDQNMATIVALRTLGVRISIDDFGSGYSSMSYLRKFSFDKLKIDRRFIEHLGENGSNADIVKAIAQLGIRIGIDTAAEGVETHSQFAAVVEHGCSEVQGYFVSKPLTASDALELITKNEPMPYSV